MFARIVYYLCVFSMVVPFQMVMFTLAKTANVLHLDSPYDSRDLSRFGAGLAVFMFAGFVKAFRWRLRRPRPSTAAADPYVFSDRVSNAQARAHLRGVLEIMWIWNDYLLPYLVLDRTKYKTIPIHIQYLQAVSGMSISAPSWR